MHIYIGVLFACVAAICADAASWGYTDQEEWAKDYPNCGLKKQSPIDIEDAKCDDALNNSITYENYHLTGVKKFPLENNGHGLKLTTASTSASIKLGSLGTFKLQQVHFHWGKDNKMGSEHQLMGKSFPAELHLVHYNSKYASIGVAVNKTDGLAVLGVFIQAGDQNPTFETFLNMSLYNVTAAGNTSKVNVAQFAMQDLLPKKRDIFYRYSGSLTTPTCDQTVTWTVFKQPISLSEDQLAEFRKLKDGKNKPLLVNYRAIQALNGREITVADPNGCNGAGILGVSILTAIFSFLFFASFH